MLIDSVRKTITKYNLIDKGDTIIVAVSGGPDSMTLLSILLSLKEEYNIKIIVAHINHGIRENAKIDEEYVKKFCKDNNIELYIKKADVKQIAKDNKQGLEEAGRCVRYEFFGEIMRNTKAQKIAIAHNLNDKAETIIMNMLRGSGVSGLKGIEPKRGAYIRPLIETSRENIEKYCIENKINPRHDESNDDNTYTRNKIRNIVIPYLKEEFNPNIIDSLNRMSEIIKEEEEYLEKQTQKAYNSVVLHEEKMRLEYNVREFNKQEKIIQKRLILLGIKKILGTTQGIEKINIEDIIKLCNNNVGNKYLMPNKNVRVGIKDKKIYVERNNLL